MQFTLKNQNRLRCRRKQIYAATITMPDLHRLFIVLGLAKGKGKSAKAKVLGVEKGRHLCFQEIPLGPLALIAKRCWRDRRLIYVAAFHLTIRGKFRL